MKRPAEPQSTAIGANADWITSMGRHSKGERHAFMVRLPETVAKRLQLEAFALGCYYNDLIAYAVCQATGVDTEVPIGGVKDHPDLRLLPDGRAQFHVRVPIEAARIVMGEAKRSRAERINYSDYIGFTVARYLNFPAVLPAVIDEELAGTDTELRLTG